MDEQSFMIQLVISFTASEVLFSNPRLLRDYSSNKNSYLVQDMFSWWQQLIKDCEHVVICFIMLDCFSNHVMFNVHYSFWVKKRLIHTRRFCVNLIDSKLLSTNGMVYKHTYMSHNYC